MDNEIRNDINYTKLEYRQEHPNCEWCIWYKYHSPSTKIPFINCADYETCELKENIIKFPKIKAKFCNYYYVKEEEIDK